MDSNPLSEAIALVGLARLARDVGVTYQAMRKWEARGRLPRTEWTGETEYATRIEIATKGRVTKGRLLAAWRAPETAPTTTCPDGPCSSCDRRATCDRRAGLAEPIQLMPNRRTDTERRQEDKEAA